MPANILTVTPTIGTGGLHAHFNVTAAAVVKASPGTLYRVQVITAGTGGSLTLNDCTTTGAAATTNQIITVAFGTLVAGYTLWIDWPCLSGIVVSAVPTGGAVLAISYS
jgi:hypothetical protein